LYENGTQQLLSLDNIKIIIELGQLSNRHRLSIITGAVHVLTSPCRVSNIQNRLAYVPYMVGYIVEPARYRYTIIDSIPRSPAPPSPAHTYIVEINRG
jgi:hypothetical protein